MNYDNVKPKAKWEFDEDVANVFDNMLHRSIPQYNIMRDLTYRIGRHFVKIGTGITDIGCSTGRAIEPFVNTYGDDVEYHLREISKPMIEKAKQNLGNIDIRECDITKGINSSNNSVVLSILTLQFTPIEYRQKIVHDIYLSMISGGAFILVEKTLGKTYDIDNVFVEEYYQTKKENAYTEKQIADKRKSLEGVLVPISSKWNEEMLLSEGFKEIDCFWKYLNFQGWIAIK